MVLFSQLQLQYNSLFPAMVFFSRFAGSHSNRHESWYQSSLAEPG